MKLLSLFASKSQENAAISAARSFFHRVLQMRRNFLTTCTQKSTQGKNLQAQAFENAENGADKVLFKSEKNSSVHKKYMNFSSARKRALDVPLYAFSGGRSMVEMLGVLAIIGVLSVGAIAGYQKAMFKYKLNKLFQQTNTIISALFRYQADLRLITHENNQAYQSLIPILKRLNEIPSEMYISGKDGWTKDAFGTECYAYHGILQTMTNVITYRCYLKRSDTSFEVCRSLYLIAKEWHKEINNVTVVAYNGDEYGTNGAYYGDTACSGQRVCLADITFDDIDKVCQVEKNESQYSVAIHVYVGK